MVVICISCSAQGGKKDKGQRWKSEPLRINKRSELRRRSTNPLSGSHFILPRFRCTEYVQGDCREPPSGQSAAIQTRPVAKQSSNLATTLVFRVHLHIPVRLSKVQMIRSTTVELALRKDSLVDGLYIPIMPTFFLRRRTKSLL
jgi:hypothetical protein